MKFDKLKILWINLKELNISILSKLQIVFLNVIINKLLFKHLMINWEIVSNLILSINFINYEHIF